MNAVLIIDGQPSDINSFIESIARKTAEILTSQIQETATAPAFSIDPARMYNLSNPEIVNYLGYAGYKRPQIAIATKMREMGISPISSVRRRGLTVSGQDVINYLQAVRKSRNSFASKN